VVGQCGDQRVVRDQHRGAAHGEPGQHGQQLVPGGAVQAGGRLVQQQHLGVAQQRPGQRDALALAPGQQAAALPDRG